MHLSWDISLSKAIKWTDHLDYRWITPLSPHYSHFSPFCCLTLLCLCVSVTRLEERESDMKKEYNALHQRHTEVTESLEFSFSEIIYISIYDILSLWNTRLDSDIRSIKGGEHVGFRVTYWLWWNCISTAGSGPRLWWPRIQTLSLEKAWHVVKEQQYTKALSFQQNNLTVWFSFWVFNIYLL